LHFRDGTDIPFKILKVAPKRLVRDGGIIAFHDIVPDHLTKYRYDPNTWREREAAKFIFMEKAKSLLP
jgi:hypothetical protein